MKKKRAVTDRMERPAPATPSLIHTNESQKESNMDFDFASIDTKKLSESGVQLSLLKLDGKPLTDRDGNPVRVTLLGPDSAKYRALTRENIRRRLEKRALGTVASDVDIDEVERETMEILTVCTVAWEGVNTPQGEPIPCTPENVRKLYEAYPVIREQVDGFVGNRANFIPASSTR